MSNEPTQSIEVAIEADGWLTIVTDPATLATDAIKATLEAASPALAEHAEVSVLLCDDQTIMALNQRFRGIAKPTNVLSFPAWERAELTSAEAPVFLGDVAVAVETVAQEAAEQHKSAQSHLAHMLVHGTLHLLGFDHQDSAQAEDMEGLETSILAGLGIADPYRLDDRLQPADGAR